MKALLVGLTVVGALAGAFPFALQAQRSGAGDAVRFNDVTLADGGATYEHASIFVRVKESAAGGYTRADYVDQSGRRLGFYEAFEVVSRDEPALRTWALRNFSNRTPAAR